MPELCREVGVGIHAGAILHAVASDEIPQVAVHDVRRPGGSLPVAMLQVAVFPEQSLLLEGIDALTEVGGRNHALAEELTGLDERSREEEHLMADGLYFIIERRIPVGQHVHVVVHKENVVRGHKRSESVEGIAHTDILRRMGVFQSFGLDPFQRAVAAVVDVDQDLVRIGGVLADARHAKFQEGEIVPRRNQYRE